MCREAIPLGTSEARNADIPVMARIRRISCDTARKYTVGTVGLGRGGIVEITIRAWDFVYRAEIPGFLVVVTEAIFVGLRLRTICARISWSF